MHSKVESKKSRIRDAVLDGNHSADMSQDATWEEPAEEGRRMEKDFHHGASASKKLKSFHSKDDQLVEHTTERGNASAQQQQSAEQNSQYDTDILQTTDLDGFVPAAIVEQSLLVIEACAGTATLSSVLKDLGFEVLPIDFGKQNLTHLHIINLDLRLKHSWDFLGKVVLSQRTLHVHGAPPCGTASRARDIALSQDHHGPPPLRSEVFPLGFPWLEGINKARVQSANEIYEHMGAFCLWLNLLSVGWSLENPANSYLWQIKIYKQLQRIGFWVQFHACCHGSTRKKLTAFLTSVLEFTGLEATCQGDHPHESWGMIRDCNEWKFATSKEAAYPMTLCQRIGSLLEMKAMNLGFRVPLAKVSTLHKVRASVGSQPKISKFPSLLQEFKTTQIVFTDMQPCVNEKLQLTTTFMDIPAGAELLRSNKQKGEADEQQQQQKHVFGIYRSQHEFVEEALTLQHPFDSCVGVPDQVLKCLAQHLTSSPLQIIKSRLTTLLAWKKKSVELQQDDEALFDGLSSGCRSVLKGKRISLMKFIAEEIGWPDKTLFDEMSSGFRLTGIQGKSGVCEDDCKPPLHSEDELMTKGKFLRPALWGKIQAEPLQEFSKPLWDITMAEATEKQWLKGPLSFEDINFLYEGDWLPVRRFAVFQKDKWRPIDDFSENGVNGSFGSMERVDLRALDETVWISVALMRSMKAGHFSFKLSDGNLLEGRVHESWYTGGTMPRPLVKTVDLKAAYKQLALNERDASKSVICLKNPHDGQVYGFACKTLPFGAVASVLHFNRFARFLKAVFLRCGVIACNYFDDYPIVELSTLGDNTDGTLRAITKLLGVTVAEEKDASFSDKTDLLGVTLDLSDDIMGEVRVCNKPDRKKDLSQALDNIITSGKINPLEIPTLFGRLQFAESQILGRAGGLAMKTLRKLEALRCKSVDISDEQKLMFGFLKSRLNHSRPRSISTKPYSPPVLVFTDGAYEPSGDSEDTVGVASIGGVIYYRENSSVKCRAFGCILPDDLVKSWASKGKKHLIGETELYAVVLARRIWASYLDNQRSIFFIDHGGVMSSCIKGNAKDATWRTLLLRMEQYDERFPSLSWFTRVPSASNIADGPSRGCFDQLTAYVRDDPCCLMTKVPLVRSENLK